MYVYIYIYTYTVYIYTVYIPANQLSIQPSPSPQVVHSPNISGGQMGSADWELNRHEGYTNHQTIYPLVMSK